MYKYSWITVVRCPTLITQGKEKLLSPEDRVLAHLRALKVRGSFDLGISSEDHGAKETLDIVGKKMKKVLSLPELCELNGRNGKGTIFELVSQLGEVPLQMYLDERSERQDKRLRKAANRTWGSIVSAINTHNARHTLVVGPSLVSPAMIHFAIGDRIGNRRFTTLLNRWWGPCDGVTVILTGEEDKVRHVHPLGRVS